MQICNQPKASSDVTKVYFGGFWLFHFEFTIRYLRGVCIYTFPRGYYVMPFI